MTDRRRFASDAEYYRHHRKVFLLALELGCTPVKAEAKMREIARRERQRAAEARRAPSNTFPAQPRSFQDWDAPYMMRN